MSREIEFRAFDNQTNKMLFHKLGESHWYTSENKAVIFEFGDHHETALKTRLSTPMQYTGLKDSKGVKVFEGDVVGKIRNDKIISYKIIKFDDFEETFYTDNFNSIAASEIYAGTCYYRGFNISKEEVCESIVMGNIYQNPELLEVKND